MPSDTSPLVARRQSAMSSLRASATIIVLRVLARLSAVRAANHWAKALSFRNLRKRQANWIMPHRTRHRDARGMNDVNLNTAHPQPARQPEAIASGLIRHNDALDLAPGLAGFVPPTMQELQQRRLIGSEPLERLALDARNNPATSHFAWLISITAMIVLSCSRAVRDLLASKACDMGRSIGLLQSAKGALPSPPAPIASAHSTQAVMPPSAQSRG